MEAARQMKVAPMFAKDFVRLVEPSTALQASTKWSRRRMTRPYRASLANDLTKKPCKCGGTMGEIIGYDERSNGKIVPLRRGWYCVECRNWEKAILRETAVEDIYLDHLEV